MIKASLALACLSVPAYSQTATTTTLTASENPTMIGRTITLTAVVTPAATGAVMFLDGFNILGTAALNGSSTAVLRLRFPAPRTYKVRAVYAGNVTFARSKSAPVGLLARSKVLAGFLPPIALPSSGRLADVNRDGVPDIVTYDSAIRLGNGDGTFQSPMASMVGFPVVVTDFNNDGNPDVFNRDRGLALGHGDGSFQPPFDADVFEEPNLVSDQLRSDAIDLNRDGKADLVLDGFPLPVEMNIRKYVLGDASGHFGPVRPVIPYSAGFADFNGNDTADGGLARSAFFDLNASDTAPILTTDIIANSAGTLIGDFNGDGLDDVVSTVEVSREPVYKIFVQLNSGAKSFLPPTIVNPTSGWQPNQLLDWDGDSFLDIVVTASVGRAHGVLAYLPGRGDGSFGSMKFIGTLARGGFVLEDITGDSVVDLVVYDVPGLPITVYPGSDTVTSSRGVQAPVSISPSSGSGVRGVFSVKYAAAVRDGVPFPGIARQYVLFNREIASQGGCFIEISPAVNQFRLWSDTGNTWLGPIAGGSAHILVSDQCVLSAGGSRTGQPTISGAVAEYESVVDVQFLGSFSSTKYLYLLSTGEDGSNSGWTEILGHWSYVPYTRPPSGPYPRPSPSVVFLAPVTGSGSSATFTGVFSHPAGTAGHYLGYMLFLPTPNVVNFVAKGSCLVEYNRISNGMRLADDAGTGWLGGASGIPIGAPGSLSNSACSVDVSRVSATLSAETMTVMVPIRFSSGVSRNIATFLQALDVDGQWTGMTQFGNWANPSGPTMQSGPSIVGTTVSTAVVAYNTARVVEITAASGSSRPVKEIHVRIGAAITQVPVCHIVFSPPGGSVALIDDIGTALVDGQFFAIGPKHTLDSGRCWFDAEHVRSSTTAPTTKVTVPLFFWNFPGTKNIYVNVFDDVGRLTHWQHSGVIIDP
ncbi:MAG TPA: FG-GAP-like repeat-containing protein [Bryobacteraceae bacterium]|nr:FG-GAP-like repeat-containing protein [Bryobacteraceae bacterium]